MDLDDVLEDLLKGARRAMRDRARERRGGRDGDRRPEGRHRHERRRDDRPDDRRDRRRRAAAARARRWLPRLAMVAGAAWALSLGLVAATVLLVTDGALGVTVGTIVAVVAALGLGPVTWGGVRLRREGRARREATVAEAHLASLPREVRDDWRRMEQARALVGELCEEGWVSTQAVAELDEHVARLGRALEAGQRSRELGGRSSDALAQQVADLADLLVALADEGVDQQAQVVAASPAPATLVQARDRMAALRAARHEVEDIDRPRGTTSTA